jgi:hypothetical protein
MTFPNGISLDLDFLTGSMPGGVTFTRASGGTYFDSTGTMQTASSNTPRLDYDPVTLAPKGLLLEEARTKAIRNSSNTGAASGTPGTIPTNWSKSNATGLAWNVAGFGTDAGIPYIDLRLSGTSSAGAVNNMIFEASGIITASVGQIWSGSAYVKLQAGSLTNIAAVTMKATQAPGGTQLQWATLTPTGAALNTQRVSGAFTVAQAGTTSIQPFLQVSAATAPVAVDATFRIGGVQCEIGTFPTAFIPTTTVAVARATDAASLALGAWFNTAAGTLYSEASWNGIVTPANCFSRSVQIDDGTQNNAIVHQVNVVGAANGIAAAGSVAGVNQWSINALATFALGTIFRQATSFATNNIAYDQNGAAINTDVVAAIPTGLTTMRFGNGPSTIGTTVGHSMNLRRIRHWPLVVPTADLLVMSQAIPAVAISARGRGVGRGLGVPDRGIMALGRSVSRGRGAASLGTRNGPMVSLIV